MTDYGLHAAREAEAEAHLRRLERQFKLYFKEAERLKGNTGENLLSRSSSGGSTTSCLASGFALSRNHARQMINHGHFR